MKIVFLSKTTRPKYPWECSTSRFCEEYLGLKLMWYQKLMLSTLDFRDRFDRKFRPKTYYARTLSGHRGLKANLLICDEDFLRGQRILTEQDGLPSKEDERER